MELTKKEKQVANAAVAVSGIAMVGGIMYAFKTKSGLLLGVGYALIYGFAGGLLGGGVARLVIKDKE
jgi:hypothetical protein